MKRIYEGILRRLSPASALRIRRTVEKVRKAGINPLIKLFCYSNYLSTQISSSAYSRQHPLARAGTERSVRALVSQLKRGDYVFDAGCGDGYALDLFRAAGLRYAGGDVNEVKLREARRHGHENVKRVDLHNLDLPSNSLEAIHCSHVLEHLLDAPKVIKEFARLLKPGGYAMVVVPLGPSNRKHPTAFIAADDLIELVSPYFCIITGGEESARGGKELWVLLQVLKETLPAQISNGATDSSAPERKLASTS